MKAIYKYRLPFQEKAVVSMPEGADIIRVDGLEGALWLWAIIDTEGTLVDREFSLFKTGGEMPDNISEYNYLGCGAIFIQMELLMYVFEKRNYSPKKSIPVVNNFDWKKVQENLDG